MNKGATAYIIRLFMQRALGLLLFLLGSWWTLGPRAAVYFTLYFATTIISCFVMCRVNPETLAERGKINTNSPKWDKVLLGLYWLLAFVVVYFVAGVESDKAPEPGALFWIGTVLQLLVTALSLWAVMVNTFLESTARVQADRGQTVCKSGPYKTIRHPTYTSVIMWCISVSLVFQTLFVVLLAAMIAVIIIIRTYLEDTMLKQELDGYEQYTKEVKYRLVPFIW